MGGGVNYFERHLGDYARDTGHLTMLEHGAYTLLMDRYYSTEKPIPADQAHRICRAKTKKERAAVDIVLAEFFEYVDGAWLNTGVEAKMAAWRRKMASLQDLRNRDTYRQFRDQVLARDRYACVYCGVANVPLQLDHVHPRSLGGSDLPANLAAACKPCNTSKGAKLLSDWMASQ